MAERRATPTVASPVRGDPWTMLTRAFADPADQRRDPTRTLLGYPQVNSGRRDLSPAVTEGAPDGTHPHLDSRFPRRRGRRRPANSNPRPAGPSNIKGGPSTNLSPSPPDLGSPEDVQ